MLKRFHNLNFPHFIGLLYLIFALPKDKVESMQFRRLSDVWYPGLFDLPTQDRDPSKARKTQSERKVKRLGVEIKQRNAVSVF